MMNTELSKQQQEQIVKFFSDNIYAKDYANILRKMIYIVVMLHLKNDDDMYRYNLDVNIYYLTHLAEILDPTGILE